MFGKHLPAHSIMRSCWVPAQLVCEAAELI